MKRLILYVLYILMAFAIICITMFCYLSYELSKSITEEIIIPEVEEPICLENVRGGLNTDYIIISSKKSGYSTKNKIEYNWDETLFYKVSNDTLYIFCGLPVKDVPIINSKVKIIQIQYSNQYYYNTLRDKYEGLGLKKFPLDRN